MILGILNDGKVTFDKEVINNNRVNKDFNRDDDVFICGNCLTTDNNHYEFFI